MTKVGRENLLVAAIVFSVAAHIALMVGIRSQVMTHVDRTGLHSQHREPMRVGDYEEIEDPVRIERIKDIMSAKEAPEAEANEPVGPATDQIPDSSKQHWEGDVPAPAAPELSSVPVPAEKFEASPLELPESNAPDPLPVADFSVPKSRALTAPELAPGAVFAMPAEFGVLEAKISVPALATVPVERTAIVAEKKPAAPEFVPSQEVYDKVDEKIVEQEKDAVRVLMNVDDVLPLEKFVNVTASRSEDAQWTYFRVKVVPKPELPVVPKDVVIILDASGSIGSERLASCRHAAKQILRSAFNTGDRFNLVAFRNNFSYAFRRWQECDKESFAAADKWLANLSAYGRTDVFGTIRSLLTLPRDPTRPLIALVVTDGDANAGVSDTAQILSKFTDLNDGLVSVYMYGVKESANRELIDVLTHGNRGESFIYGGLRWKAGTGIEKLSDRFRDPVLSDIRVVFAANSQAEAYPRLIKNLYRGDAVTIVGRVPKGRSEVAFSLKGLNGKNTYEAFFKVPLGKIATDPSLGGFWAEEAAIDAKLK
ncbi:MAG: VWA domain-containing protein [Kiritimatiellae bacterium]|nr:VWA domain-containing protein [Kiritimatiellia bacterium]